MKVIIIDDEPLARSIVKEFLGQYPDIEVVQECGDGFEGVKAIQQYQPDLVILDIQMPKMDGFATVEALKRISSVIPNGPIYFLTNNEDEVAVAKGISLDVQGYLIKSQYTPDKLVVEVKRILEEEKAKTIK